MTPIVRIEQELRTRPGERTNQLSPGHSDGRGCESSGWAPSCPVTRQLPAPCRGVDRRLRHRFLPFGQTSEFDRARHVERLPPHSCLRLGDPPALPTSTCTANPNLIVGSCDFAVEIQDTAIVLHHGTIVGGPYGVGVGGEALLSRASFLASTVFGISIAPAFTIAAPGFSATATFRTGSEGSPRLASPPCRRWRPRLLPQFDRLTVRGPDPLGSG
jgi:hypothetical protein